MRFEFATAGRIVFGAGAAGDLPAIIRSVGTRALVITGRDPGRHATLIRAIETTGCRCTSLSVSGEPTVDVVRDAAARARAETCDVVVAIGGGSAIDTGKAIAALAVNPGDAFDYLEVVGKGLPLTIAPLPFIAVPTTAGTGSEVTRNAVLGVPEHQVKVSLRSALMLPRIALVDPDLTIDLPPAITATTGLDALTQLIEPYVSTKANPFIDALAIAGMRAAAEGLAAAYRDGDNRAARERMSYASLIGGIALANAGLGVVHALAAPLGGMFSAPHGALCAALLAPGMRANLAALRRQTPAAPALARFGDIARTLTGRADASADDGIDWVQHLVGTLGIAPLREYGITARDIDDVAAKALRANSAKTNPVALSAAEVAEVVRAAL